MVVHAGLHGVCIWYWYKVANKLKSEGHNFTTLYMVACGGNPKHMMLEEKIVQMGLRPHEAHHMKKSFFL